MDHDEREVILTALAAGDFVGVQREITALELTKRDCEMLMQVAATRGGS